MADQVKPSMFTRLGKVLLAILLPLTFFAVVEGALRFSGVGEDRELSHPVTQHGRQWLQVNQQVSKRYFVAQPEFAREAEEALIYPEKNASLLRIVCLGGSSMAGFPYGFNATMPGMLYTRLKQLYPKKTIEVINLGIPAVSSFAVRDLIRDVVDLSPDAVLIYTGHNEFYGALGVASGFRFGQNRHLINLSLDLQALRLFYLLQKLFSSSSESSGVSGDKGVMARMAAHKEIPLDDPLVKQAADNLYANLAEAADFATDAGIPVFIGTLASNLSDHPPFISSKYDPIPDSLLFTTSATNNLFSVKALDYLDKRISADTACADLYYQKGLWLQYLQDWQQAKTAFQKAREHDLLRFRAPAQFNRIIRQVCNESEAILIDVESAIADVSPQGLISGEMITEHLHPTIAGYQTMMLSFLNAMHQKSILPGGKAQEVATKIGWRELYITDLDAEIGAQQIAKLTSQWPFREQVNLPVETDRNLYPALQAAVNKYSTGKLKWGGAHLEYGTNISQSPFKIQAAAEYLAVLNFYPEKYMGNAAADVYLALADVYQNMGKTTEAAQVLWLALKVDGNHRSVTAKLGRLLVKQRRFKEAEPLLKVACRQPTTFNEQEFSQLLFLWGGCLASLKRIPEAKAKFQQVIRINPSHSQARAFLQRLK